jgi:hypothetical protein
LEIGGKPIPWGLPFYSAIDMYWNSSLQAPITIAVHFRYSPSYARNPPDYFIKLENMAMLRNKLKNGIKSVF